MDSNDSAYSALDAIDTVAFKIGVRGYNVDEVDDFLERLSGESTSSKNWSSNSANSCARLVSGSINSTLVRRVMSR